MAALPAPLPGRAVQRRSRRCPEHAARAGSQRASPDIADHDQGAGAQPRGNPARPAAGSPEAAFVHRAGAGGIGRPGARAEATLIFRSQLAAQESRGAVSEAFAAIAETQQKAAVSDWYVTQPDHGRISGELAAALDSRKVPNLSRAVVRAIALHDMGWMPYDGDVTAPRAPTKLESGVAVSFAT